MVKATLAQVSGSQRGGRDLVNVFWGRSRLAPRLASGALPVTSPQGLEEEPLPLHQSAGGSTPH